ncbi:MAG: hypothetical protein WCH76_04200 [Candidatus Riflemargulisbacteria bacterium]
MTENILLIMPSSVKDAVPFVSASMLQTVIIGFLTIFIAVAFNFQKFNSFKSRVFIFSLQPKLLIVINLLMLLLLSVNSKGLCLFVEFLLTIIFMIINMVCLFRGLNYLQKPKIEEGIKYFKNIFIKVAFNIKPNWTNEAWGSFWEDEGNFFNYEILKLFIQQIDFFMKQQKFTEAFGLIQIYTNNILKKGKEGQEGEENINSFFHYEILLSLLKWYKDTEIESYKYEQNGESPDIKKWEKLRDNYMIKNLIIIILTKVMDNKITVHYQMYDYLSKIMGHLENVSTDETIKEKYRQVYIQNVIEFVFQNVITYKNIKEQKIQVNNDLPPNMRITLSNYVEVIYSYLFECFIEKIYKNYIPFIEKRTCDSSEYLKGRVDLENFHREIMSVFDVNVVMQYVSVLGLMHGSRENQFIPLSVSDCYFHEEGQDLNSLNDERLGVRKNDTFMLIWFNYISDFGNESKRMFFEQIFNDKEVSKLSESTKEFLKNMYAFNKEPLPDFLKD